MQEIKLYIPHSNQKLVHASSARYRVVVAGRRFGKSALALNEAIALALQNRNYIIWIILPLFRQAKEVYWIDPDITRYFMPLVQAGLIRLDQNELSMHFRTTNSWIRLKGSDNYDSLRGSGLDFIVWDEVADVKEEAFETIKPALADSPAHRVLYIGTPKGLNWFHDFALRGDRNRVFNDFGKSITAKNDWESWHFTSYDNLSWLPGTKEYTSFKKYIDEQKEEAEEKGKLAFFNQEYMASFEESSGRFFPRWSYSSHTLDSYEPKGEVDLYGSMDWGRTAPFAWYANAVIPINFEGVKFNRIITFKEVYGGGKSPMEQAELINRTLDYRRIKKTYFDPSMSTPQNDGSMSVADQFKYAFRELTKETPQLEAAGNKRVSRWAAMDNWIRFAPDGLPYWLITKDCTNLIRTLPMMTPDPNNIDDLDTTLEDHAVDSISYFMQNIKWVDATVFYKKQQATFHPKLPMYKEVLDLSKFENVKKKRDWRRI